MPLRHLERFLNRTADIRPTSERCERECNACVLPG